MTVPEDRPKTDTTDDALKQPDADSRDCKTRETGR
jgi:hypothetical protein